MIAAESLTWKQKIVILAPILLVILGGSLSDVMLRWSQSTVFLDQTYPYNVMFVTCVTRMGVMVRHLLFPATTPIERPLIVWSAVVGCLLAIQNICYLYALTWVLPTTARLINFGRLLIGALLQHMIRGELILAQEWWKLFQLLLLAATWCLGYCQLTVQLPWQGVLFVLASSISYSMSEHVMVQLSILPATYHPTTASIPGSTTTNFFTWVQGWHGITVALFYIIQGLWYQIEWIGDLNSQTYGYIVCFFLHECCAPFISQKYGLVFQQFLTIALVVGTAVFEISCLQSVWLFSSQHYTLIVLVVVVGVSFVSLRHTAAITLLATKANADKESCSFRRDAVIMTNV